MLRLDVYDGSHRRTLTVDADIVRVGRGPECEVVLAGDTTVSRVHAMLTHTPDGWTVSDNASRNGTFVNGRRLDSERPLAPADRVLIGNFILVPQSAGDSDQQIADALFISVKTVQSHLDRIRTKSGARRRVELIRFAMDHGIA